MARHAAAGGGDGRCCKRQLLYCLVALHVRDCIANVHTAHGTGHNNDKWFNSLLMLLLPAFCGFVYSFADSKSKARRRRRRSWCPADFWLFHHDWSMDGLVDGWLVVFAFGIMTQCSAPFSFYLSFNMLLYHITYSSSSGSSCHKSIANQWTWNEWNVCFGRQKRQTIFAFVFFLFKRVVVNVNGFFI